MRWKPVLTVAAVIAALSALLLWWLDSRKPDSDVSHLVECGHDGPAVESPLIDDIKAVPEFHDCQRFIVDVDGQPRYDSLFAIYASSSLPGLMTQLEGPATGGGTTGGGGLTEPGNPGGGNAGNASIVQVPDVTILVSVGLVVAGNAYAPLGIEEGLNCLYVGRRRSRVAGLADTWVAYMLQKVPTGEAGCTPTQEGRIDPARATPLQVVRTTFPQFAADSDYPKVARWDWDPKARKQYVGIYCGTAWCEIGEQGFTPSEPLPAIAGLSTGELRVRTIKGWYDQQFLAKRGPEGTLVPSGVLGTIVAHPDLGAKGDQHFREDYVEVASVFLSSPGPVDEEALAEYKRKFGFVPNAPNTSDGSRRLFIRTKDGGEWKARIPTVNGLASHLPWGRKQKDVIRRPVNAAFKGKGYEVPGVARWRWMKTDEGTWTRCSAGCCEMSE